MIEVKKHKSRIAVALLLLMILMIYIFPMNYMNSSNFQSSEDILNEEDDEFNDNFNDFRLKTNPKLSLLGDDPWWNSSWKCRMIINVTNPYPYDFENYGVSVSFNYKSLGQNIQPSLNDIRIVENGTLVKYYVKKDYPTTDMATVWFDTTINDTVVGDDVETDTYMYFGNLDALNAEAINPSDSFGWIKNGDFEIDIHYSKYFDPYGWTFSHDPIDSIHGEANPGVTDENPYGVEFCNKLLNVSTATQAERVYQGNIAYKFGADRDVLGFSDVYNSYAGAFFSYPFTVPRVYGAGIDLHLYRNPRTWGFCTDTPIDDDGYYIRLCDNYGPDPDTHTDIGGGYDENYIEIWGGRAFYTGSANKPGNWQHATKVRNWDKSVTMNTNSETSNDGELTAPLNFTISKFEGDTIFLELGVWGTESKYRSGFFQLDDVRYNYTDISTNINELQYINSTATIITRDVDGRIVPNAEVMLVDSTLPKGSPGYQIARGFSDPEGRITFKDLENRRYNITANYTVGSQEREVFNSYDLGTGPYYFNGIFYTEEITLNLWTIDFEIVDWDGIPLKLGYIEVNKSGGNLIDTLMLDENGKAMFRWLNNSDYYIRVYYDNDDYGDALLLNESYISRSSYDKKGDKYQEYSIWVNKTNTDTPGDPSYSISEYIYTNGSRSELGNKKIIKVNISLTDMIDQLTDIKIYYVDKYNSIGTDDEHLIYSEDGYDIGEDSDFIELDIPLIDNTKLESEYFEVYGLLIVVNGLNFSGSCDGIIKVETLETCNIYNRTHLARINIQTIDTYDNPISSVVKISDITAGQFLINLSASSTTTNGYAYDSNDLPFWYFKDRTYNFTIDAYNLTNVVFDIDYVDPPQWEPQGITWYNFTLEKNSTIIFMAYLPGVNISDYLTDFSNSSGTGYAYWGENVSFSLIFEYTDDNGQTWFPITDPSARCTLYIRETGGDIDFITRTMVPGTGNGNFTITLNSNLLSAGGGSKFYNVRIEGSYPGYPDPSSQGFLLEIKAIPTTISAHDYDTQVELPDKLYIAYYDELVNIMIQYSINESGTPLTDANLKYAWMGLAPIDINSDHVYTDFYTFTLNTSDAQSTGIKIIAITASFENYTTQSDFLIYLNILERRTTLNGETDLVYHSPRIWIQYPEYFNFTYRDYNTNKTLGDLTTVTYTWQELYANGSIIPGRDGSGSLVQNVDRTYTLDFNTELKPVGYYYIYITMQKQNYEARAALINLEIMLRNFDVTIEANNRYRGANDQIKVVQGDDIDFEISLIDITRNNITLVNASVFLTIGNTDYKLEETIPGVSGVYEYTFGTNHIDAFFTSKTLSGKITIQVANFTTQEIPITIVVKMEEIFPGMPTFYFILITASIVGVVGSVVGYRVIQQARIPKHVKKIRKVKGLIKSKKKITESYDIPTKEQMMAKLFGNDWKEIGLSIEDALGIQELKKKLPLKGKISKEGGEDE